MTGINIKLPDIFPDSDVTVDEEQHLFDVNDGSFEDLEQLEYTLNKAPIISIKEVTGTKNGGDYTFQKGVDYELSNDANRLIWLENQLPDNNTAFYVTYHSESIISRYIASSEEELELSEKHIREAIESKFIETAEDEELDQLGKLFGEIIGQRRGRSDEEYRTYLKSVVQSFTSRGTQTGIKLAISAATDIPIEDIEIIEDFYRNEYSIGILPQTPVSGSLLEDVAEIADPSGIKQASTRFRPEPEETRVNDDLSITEGKLIEELLKMDDVASVNTNLIDGQKLDEGVVFDDALFIDRNQVVSTEDVGLADNAVIDSTAINNFEWGQKDRWNFMEWTA